jgi:microcystin-dependent protein
MNRGNFLGQSNRDFPVDCETLDFLQANQELLAVLGQIGGDKTILSGCVKTGTTVAPGYIFLKTAQYPEGEVLKFDGGTIDSVTTTIYVSETATAVTAQGYTYPQAYYSRSLKAGLGAEQFLWADFSRVETNAALKARVQTLESQVASLAPPAIGIPQMFTGYVSKIPPNMVLYDGRALNISEYPEAYDVWGTMYNTQNGRTTPAGQFRMPDMSGAFIAGYSASDDDYSEVGKQGGEKTHVLTISEMPKHSFKTVIVGNNNEPPLRNDSEASIVEYRNDRNDGNSDYVLDGKVGTPTHGKTNILGGDQAHENRPPFFTVAYIGRIK